MTEPVALAVIGGTGFYEAEGMENVRLVDVDTPYGPPSDTIRIGSFGGPHVAFLSRHGAGHRLLPSEIPQRANIWALASLGVQRVISVSAVGSLKEEIAPRHLVLPDQIIDHTTGQRPSTFFGDGVVAHISFADPFCSDLNHVLHSAAAEQGAIVHGGGMMVVIEGPAFSTRAESQMYRSWGASVIGMTASPEAKLAREAGMCYASLACVTDYDTWHSQHASVTVDVIFENLRATVETAKAVVARVARNPNRTTVCAACEAQPDALVTPREAMPASRRRDLAPVLGRYTR